jgi:hypothetical protein
MFPDFRGKGFSGVLNGLVIAVIATLFGIPAYGMRVCAICSTATKCVSGTTYLETRTVCSGITISASNAGSCVNASPTYCVCSSSYGYW